MSEKKFPDNFLWGAATSAYQVEGNNKNSDWWQWEKDKVENDDRSGLASDHYNRYKEDIAIMKDLGFNSFRLGIEWARIEPRKGEWDQSEIEHYKDVLKELKKNNIKSVVTLHHFTNPQWLMDEGGWENKKVVEYFANFSQKIVSELGDLIDYIITINEPIIFIDQAYVIGHRIPEKKDYEIAKKVYQILINAHKESYKAIKKVRDIPVSIAKDERFLPWLTFV